MSPATGSPFTPGLISCKLKSFPTTTPHHQYLHLHQQLQWRTPLRKPHLVCSCASLRQCLSPHISSQPSSAEKRSTSPNQPLATSTPVPIPFSLTSAQRPTMKPPGERDEEHVQTEVATYSSPSPQAWTSGDETRERPRRKM